jgi:2-hydroxychromene-2-carboxylate isomerase
VKTPDFFPILSLFPQRALCFIKEKHPRALVSTFLDIYEAMWKNGKDVSKPEVLVETLKSRFSSEEIEAVVSSANSAPFKQKLNDNTKEALDRGAFGAPWFWVRNAKGAEEPFFGSDRYATAPLSPLSSWRTDPCLVWRRRSRMELCLSRKDLVCMALIERACILVWCKR